MDPYVVFLCLKILLSAFFSHGGIVATGQYSRAQQRNVDVSRAEKMASRTGPMKLGDLGLGSYISALVT